MTQKTNTQIEAQSFISDLTVQLENKDRQKLAAIENKIEKSEVIINKYLTQTPSPSLLDLIEKELVTHSIELDKFEKRVKSLMEFVSEVVALKKTVQQIFPTIIRYQYWSFERDIFAVSHDGQTRSISVDIEPSFVSKSCMLEIIIPFGPNKTTIVISGKTFVTIGPRIFFFNFNSLPSSLTVQITSEMTSLVVVPTAITLKFTTVAGKN